MPKRVPPRTRQSTSSFDWVKKLEGRISRKRVPAIKLLGLLRRLDIVYVVKRFDREAIAFVEKPLKMKYRIGSICSGMGMHLHGLDGKTVWGIECDPEIADCYRANHGGLLYVNYVQEIDPKELPDVDCLIATPSCKNASIASGGSETEEDVEVGRAIAQFIKTKLPKVFVIENVWGYRKFQSFREIEKALAESGYYFRYYKLNCADWGVAQSRVRLYGVAVRNGAFWDITSPGCKGVGWYRAICLWRQRFAIADLIPSLKEVQLAPWQKAKFPCLSQTCLLPDHSNWTSIVKAEKPASTVRAGHQSFKALIKRDGGGRQSDRIYDPDEPAFTIRAFGRKASNHSQPGNAIADGRVVGINARACLRFFGDALTADKIWLPPKKALAQEVVGNGASWVMMKSLIERLGVFS